MAVATKMACGEGGEEGGGGGGRGERECGDETVRPRRTDVKEGASESTYQGKFMSHCEAGGVGACVYMCVVTRRSENQGWVAPSEPVVLGLTHSP